MTPETRAARDWLARFAGPDFRFTAPDPPGDLDHVTIPELKRMLTLVADGIRDTLAPDIRVVLAVLDRHERARDPSTWREPCNVALSHTNGEIRCQLAVSEPLPEGYLESGGRYTGNRNHWEEHWHQDEHGQVRTWTDNESE